MVETTGYDRTSTNPDGSGTPRWIVWMLVALAAIVVVGGLFFALGGDADVDVDPGSVDVDAPSADVDVDAPDVDVESPDVDVDPGSVDIDDADAEADAG
jgi:hypothetical protein